MRKEYDLTGAVKNPYTKVLKKQITIRLEPDTIAFFQEMSKENGVPYQTLIDMYLTDCARKKRKLKWSA